MFKRQQPIPIIQAGGHQPYAQAGGREPGPSLLAMLNGATLGGQNPADPWRAMQMSASRGRRRTLLDQLRS